MASTKSPLSSSKHKLRRIRGSFTLYSNIQRDNPVQSIDPEGGRTQYSYTPGGKLTGILDAKAGVTAYRYDENGNLIVEVFKDGILFRKKARFACCGEPR